MPVANSTGLPGLIEHQVQAETLTISQLPASAFLGLTGGLVAWSLPFGDGVSCVSPMVGWLRTPPQIADSNGAFVYSLNSIPQLNNYPIGTTVHLQAWYRDVQGGVPFATYGFNFTNRVSITQ